MERSTSSKGFPKVMLTHEDGSYKDGELPGELAVDKPFPEKMAAGLAEASDQHRALAAGETFARFHDDVMRDRSVSGATRVIVGHSWGLANLTASEVHGARYDTVISLSGAYMPDGWKADPETHYAHHAYAFEWLVAAQAVDEAAFLGPELGSGDFPGSSDDFERHVYVRRDPNFVEDHDLIHRPDLEANQAATHEIRTDVYK
ncbi:hypothetical protein [Salinibacterium sp. ZJ70]|uniref:hypothetical protein n=1 Tax=Salinibacterium sp. ZJ70 TaxID=2708084 RepID=UPI00142405D5|nr:hypothetical protein [Salinibacterium sp. ZJ70]